MGWFDRQVLQRKQSDQEILEDSLEHIASAVTGKHHSDRQAGGRARSEWAFGGQTPDNQGFNQLAFQDAVNDILRWYDLKPAKTSAGPANPEDETTPEELLSLALRPHGLMWREVKLEPGWYKDAMGPILAFRKKDGSAAALLPGTFSGYVFYPAGDESGEVSGPARPRRVTAETAALFEEYAFCFYQPLPLKKLTVQDLLLYLKDCLDTGDCVFLFLLTLSVTLLGMLMTGITRFLTGFVLESAGSSAVPTAGVSQLTHAAPAAPGITLLAGTSVFLISVLLASQLLGAARQLMMSRIRTKASVALEAAVMMRVMNLPPAFFRRHSSGELASRCDAVNQLCGLLLGAVFSTGLGAVLSLLYITQIFHYAPPLALPSLLILFAGLALSLLSGLTQMRVSRTLMEKSAAERGLSFSLISATEKIRLAGAEKRAFAKWGHAYAETATLTYNPPMLLRVGAPLSLAVSLAGTAVLYYLAVRHAVTPSEYIAFSAAYGAVSASFSALTGVALSVAGIRPILEMAAPILEAEPENAGTRTQVTSLTGNIELSNVRFRYRPSGPWVIDGLDLKIRAGEYVGIVGTTGCGKTTLVRLLLGFETPVTGAVNYDGKDAAGLDLHSLRRHIGTVMQDGSLFQGDIFSNIAVTAPGMSLADAWEAAELAGIADEIRAMPMGMNTLISEGQGGISGGQKQRILIARALAPKPRILIFDEATSALDNRTQQQVSEALDRLKCTRIVIAHRLSTIRNCSRILMLDGGKIAESGTYDELLRKNGLFAELIARQRLDA